MLKSLWNADTDKEITQPLTVLTLTKPDNVKKDDDGVTVNDDILNANGSFNLVLQDYIARTVTHSNGKSEFTSVKIFNNDIWYIEFNSAAEPTYKFKLDLAYQRFNNFTFRLDSKVSEGGVSLNQGYNSKICFWYQVRKVNTSYLTMTQRTNNQQRIDNDDAAAIKGSENCLAYRLPVDQGNNVKRQLLFNGEVNKKKDF